MGLRKAQVLLTRTKEIGRYARTLLAPTIQILRRRYTIRKITRTFVWVIFRLCAEQDLNLRSPKASDLQSDVIDHSTIDA